MKNLANCTPDEFFAQSVKIRKAVKNWLDLTDIMNIRKRKPPLPESMTQPEKRDALMRQAQENISLMFDAIMEKHPNETRDLMAMLCFVEPEQANDHKMGEYFASLYEMLNDEGTVGFFTSLIQLARMATSKRLKA